MNPIPPSEYDEQDGDKPLKDLGALEVPSPIELFAARRAAFLAQVDQLIAAGSDEECSSADDEIVRLLETVKPAQADYPSDLLTARQATFVRQIENAGRISLVERFRVFLQRIVQTETTHPHSPPAGLMRISLTVASLFAALFLGSALFARAQASFSASLSQVAVTPTAVLPMSTSEVAITICTPDDPASTCPPGELDPNQDLADPGNGVASPAISKDVHLAHQAKYVNDGRGGASWVSNSPYSWIKLDLGQVRTINMVSLEKGRLVSSPDNELGSFVIAVAISDVYADGDSGDDYREYTQVFHSEQAGFRGIDPHTELIKTLFSPVEARFVKIMFEKAGAAIEEVGVFLVEEPPVLAAKPTRIPRDDLPGIFLIPTHTNTSIAVYTSTSIPTHTPTDTPTRLSTHTAEPPTNTPPPSVTPTLPPTQTKPPTSTPLPSDTPTPLPTETQPAVDTSTPVPTALLPTLELPTAIVPTVQLTSASTEPIVVTQSDQTLIFSCNGNAAEIRGHANTVTLLGSCSSITVTGNGNRVFWQSGSPVITAQGQDNIVSPQ